MLLLGGCQTAPIPNPDGLGAEAQTLEYVLDRGCFAYMLGEQTEYDAMRSLGLNRQGPPPSIFAPSGSPRWFGFYAGLSDVVVGKDSCSVNMKRRDAAEYQAATQRVLRRRFGDLVEQEGRSGYKSVLPGQITGCHSFVRYSYYSTSRIFSVDLNRVDCARDPMRAGRP